LRPEVANGSFLEHKRHIRIAARRNLAEVVLQPFAACIADLETQLEAVVEPGDSVHRRIRRHVALGPKVLLVGRSSM